MEVLLHSCCFVCSIETVEHFKKEGHKLKLFWYNPNIHPYKEYEARLKALKAYAKGKELDLYVNDFYGLRYFIKNLNSEFDNRCSFCYKDRLTNTAKFAKQNGFDAFSTTLLYSPYQDHENIKKIGEQIAKEEGVEFLYKDLRSKFRQGQKKARETGFYMQKYCGCIFSEQERYLKKHL